MAIARSVAQQRFDAEYRRIDSKRDIETAMSAALEFISAVSTSLVIVDMVQVLGFTVSMALALSVASLLFFGALGFTVACGIICGVYIVQEGRHRKDAELALMRDCFTLATTQERKIEEFKIILEKLLKINDDPFIRARYNRMINNEDVNNAVLEINGYIKTTMQDRFPDLVRQNKQKEARIVYEGMPRPNYGLSNIIAFFSGAGLMLGISATIIGASTLPALLLTPLGWGVLALVIVASLAVGTAMAYFDYQMRQSQQAHIEEKEDEKTELFAANKRLDKTALRVEDYMVILSLQKESAAPRQDENVGLLSDESIISHLDEVVIPRADVTIKNGYH